MGSVGRLSQLEQQRQDGVWQRGDADPICQVVQRYSKATERILVWGFDGDIYVSCDRSPATKYVYSTMVMGVVPPFWYRNEQRWVAPGARVDAAHELLTVRPPLILENRDRFHGMPMSLIPELKEVLKREYCSPLEATGNGRRTWHTYLRKDLGCERLKSDPAFAPTFS